MLGFAPVATHPVATLPDVAAAVVVDDFVSGGKGDNPEKKRTVHVPYKPTGLIERKRKKAPESATQTVEQRIADSAEIHAEITARGFDDVAEPLEEILAEGRISLDAMEFEIAAFLHKKIRTEQEETMLLLMLAAVG